MNKIQVVVGSSYGDEGKGMVCGCLTNAAVAKNEKVLNICYNGGVQRAHTYLGKVYHCTGAGAAHGADTYYHDKFILDPIALWISGERVIISPECRVVLPCDVVNNRALEVSRGKNRHGSCGMGIFECVKRSTDKEKCVLAGDLTNSYALFKKLRATCTNLEKDELYNIDNWMRAVAYVLNHCTIAPLKAILHNYDTIIYEGGQGLALDQSNIGNFPHLTPSSTGAYNIANEIALMNAPTEVYYVSRTYETRHGNGPMTSPCAKSDINAAIVDETNQPNEWQGSLRFGYLDVDGLYGRIKKDLNTYTSKVSPRLVFTQTNYTNGGLKVNAGTPIEIAKPDFVDFVYTSNKKDRMEIKL